MISKFKRFDGTKPMIKTSSVHELNSFSNANCEYNFSKLGNLTCEVMNITLRYMFKRKVSPAYTFYEIDDCNPSLDSGKEQINKKVNV